MASQLTFDKKELKTEQSFTLVYSGPSFESGIKVDKFIGNLESVKDLIYTIAEINLEYKSGRNTKDEITIKIVPNSGSIEEQIIIMFSNPEVGGAIFSVFLTLFFYLLAKKDAKKDAKKQNEKLDKIEKNQEALNAKVEELISRNQSKNIRNLYVPLEKSRDKLSIKEHGNTELEIEYNQKIKLDNAIKEMEEELKIVEKEEELEGQISAINIDTEYLKFHVKGMPYAYPLYSDIPISKLVHHIALPIRAKLKVRRIKGKIKDFYMISYKVLQSGLSIEKPSS